ncbi:leucine-rich alpha-2-glycoprotein [Lacerta agilis]|uniref:leucine-rich alpha-2-glycoprotein n=1 Tax=Lacerta agilis TaxID=80427 RepID=UPI00141A0296|nr:leucine-rich alpha-2-glycoprotein [Lacerta agilis]
MMASSVLIFIVCMVLSLHCCCLQALQCPPVDTPSNITEFSCSSPSLSHFPAGFPEQTTLISVEFTNISTIGEDALLGLPKLQELHLSNNRLKDLPSGLFRDLPQLHTLDLTSNLLEDLPPSIFENSTSLTHLFLKMNQLANLRPQWFKPLRRLETLDLSNNQLKDVPPSCFSTLENLTALDLSFNFLRQLSPQILEGMPLLERLELGANQLRSIADKTFQEVPRLGFLFLQNNSLTRLPPGIFEPLRNLDTLFISDNQIASWDPRFSGQLTQLSLDLARNPWACDCRMRTFVNWVTRHSAVLYSREEVVCASPKSLKGRVVMSLGDAEYGTC